MVDNDSCLLLRMANNNGSIMIRWLSDGYKMVDSGWLKV